MRISILIKPVNADFALKELFIGDEGEVADVRFDPRGIGFLTDAEANRLGEKIQEVVNKYVKECA